MTIALPELPDNPCLFPDPVTALDSPNGLLAFGGDLSPTRLISAYRLGIFPWFNPGEPILWWSPNPRAVIRPGEVHVSRSLAKWLRKTPYRYTLNQAFTQVLSGCSGPRSVQQGTWLSPLMRAAYIQLHQLKQAHSVEVWLDGELVGGLYGVAIGQIFCGESMFHRHSNASKAAFVMLHQHLKAVGMALIDCQLSNPHLASMGVNEIPRSLFLDQLAALRDAHLAKEAWQPQELHYVR